MIINMIPKETGLRPLAFRRFREEANRLGVEFAKRFTKGNHAFVVCTHIDKSHIHNVRPDRAMRKAV